MHRRKQAVSIPPDMDYSPIQDIGDHPQDFCVRSSMSAINNSNQALVSSIAWAELPQSAVYTLDSPSTSSLCSYAEPTTQRSCNSTLFSCDTSTCSPEDISKSIESSDERYPFVKSIFSKSSPSVLSTVPGSTNNQWMLLQHTVPNASSTSLYNSNISLSECCALPASLETPFAAPSNYLYCSTKDKEWRQSPNMLRLPLYGQVAQNHSQNADQDLDCSWVVSRDVMIPSISPDGSSTSTMLNEFPASVGCPKAEFANMCEVATEDAAATSATTKCDPHPSLYDHILEHDFEQQAGELEEQGYTNGITSVPPSDLPNMAQPGRSTDYSSSLRLKRQSKLRKRSCSRHPKVATTLYRDSLGRHFQCPLSSTKNWKCSERVGDSECGKSFERVEHLRRHEKTHTGEKDFTCPLPARFNCGKRLDRKDNWRDHLKTHLKKSILGRNERCNKEEMYQALRDYVDGEESEKTIAILEKWLAETSGEADESASAQKR